MKWDFAIGNPAYQAAVDESSDNKTYSAPVYNCFLDEAVKVADKVEMIHPARFLFNAGSTPKAWNEKMLNDPHFKVLSYEEDASKVFSNTDIKGGIVITYHDKTQDFGAIGIFTKHSELNAILRKVLGGKGFSSLSKIVMSRTAYRLTDKMHADYPDALKQLSDGHPYDMATNIFDRLPQIFHNTQPRDKYEYIRILGREDNGRTYKYVRRDYVNHVLNLDCFKIIIPSANGMGHFGEILSHPLICEPGVGSTETFLGIGMFETRTEAERALKYVKTKFARSLLGVLKTTQHVTPDKWKYVPMQDFSAASDIDWATSIANIDKQLYKKYGLSQEEIDFIESHVKEME